jgi:hypothetical protein
VKVGRSVTQGILFEIPRLAPAYLRHVLAAQQACNLEWLRSAVSRPPLLYTLYPAVFYFEDPHHQQSCVPGSIPADSSCATERFSCIPSVLERGYGDCKDLATWRAAELNLAGIEAVAVPVPSTLPRTIHIVVRLWNGDRDDPSETLGMAAYLAAKDRGQERRYFRRMRSLSRLPHYPTSSTR